ncbi:MAG: carboxypeptidase-like regulatory domain-containing protein [bacterium]
MKITGLLGCIAAFLAQGCVNNPFGSSDISLRGRQIEGTVRLDSNAPPAGVYVWLEGFDLATRTDSQGHFKVTLPPPFSRPASDGISGAFSLYYYVANFALAATRIATQEGRIVNADIEMNADGTLLEPVLLKQRLRIDTRVRPAVVSNSQITVTGGLTDFLLRVDVTLQAIRDSVLVTFPGVVDGMFGPLMFRNLETDDVRVLSSTIAGVVSSAYDTVKTDPHVRTMVVPIFPDDLEVGEYEVIPYLFVEDEPVPDGIRKRLRIEFIGPGPDYLEIPFLRTGAGRTVKIIP